MQLPRVQKLTHFLCAQRHEIYQTQAASHEVAGKAEEESGLAKVILMDAASQKFCDLILSAKQELAVMH